MRQQLKWGQVTSSRAGDSTQKRQKDNHRSGKKGSGQTAEDSDWRMETAGLGWCLAKDRKEKNKVSCPHHDVSKASAPLLPKGCIECSRCPAEKWPKRIAEIEQNFIGHFPPFQAPLPTPHSCQIARSHLPAADAELFNYSSSFQNTCAARKSPPKKRVVLFRLLGHFLNLSWILVGHVIVLQLNSSSLTPTPPSKNKGKHIIIRHLLLTVHF